MTATIELTAPATTTFSDALARFDAASDRLNKLRGASDRALDARMSAVHAAGVALVTAPATGPGDALALLKVLRSRLVEAGNYDHAADGLTGKFSCVMNLNNAMLDAAIGALETCTRSSR